MTERPILFRPEMVRAILDGRKSQTRRIVKPQPVAGVRNSPFVPSQLEDGHGREIRCRYGYIGDRLYVRERWAVCDHCGVVDYAADPSRCCRGCDGPRPTRWKPSIYLRRDDSRLTLEITEIRMERVREISEDDARAEGMTTGWFGLARWEFRELWERIHAKDGFGWDVNPFVWMLTFKVIP